MSDAQTTTTTATLYVEVDTSAAIRAAIRPGLRALQIDLTSLSSAARAALASAVSEREGRPVVDLALAYSYRLSGLPDPRPDAATITPAQLAAHYEAVAVCLAAQAAERQRYVAERARQEAEAQAAREIAAEELASAILAAGAEGVSRWDGGCGVTIQSGRVVSHGGDACHLPAGPYDLLPPQAVEIVRQAITLRAERRARAEQEQEALKAARAAEATAALAYAVEQWGDDDQRAAQADGILRHTEAVEVALRHLLLDPLDALGVVHSALDDDEPARASSVAAVSSAAAATLRRIKAALAGHGTLVVDLESSTWSDTTRKAYTAELTLTWRGVVLTRRVVLADR